jgi:pimeloyl-ACP methyl ester carboxylesterase
VASEDELDVRHADRLSRTPRNLGRDGGARPAIPWRSEHRPGAREVHHRAAWDLVADELRNRGRRVEVVALHRGSLLADTEAVQEVVDLLGEPVVVCGWSYGGMVITGLALGASSHLVYLCALMPAEGESAIELGSRHPGGLAALVDTDEAGDLVLRGDQLDEILWADAPSETAAMARTMLRPQAKQSFLEAPPRVAWRQTPSTYVVGRYDRVFHRRLVDEMASRASTVIEWKTSHSPLLSRPDLVVDLLARIDAG